MNIRDDLGLLKQRLKELADVINAFRSEAVQLRVLDMLMEGATADSKEGGVKRLKKDRPGKKGRVAQTTDKEEVKPKSKSARTSAGRGSFAAVSNLVIEGFFKTPKAIRQVIDHCSTHKGLHFKANEISPCLLRLLRNTILTRKKNKDNQYEYVQKG